MQGQLSAMVQQAGSRQAGSALPPAKLQGTHLCAGAAVCDAHGQRFAGVGAGHLLLATRLGRVAGEGPGCVFLCVHGQCYVEVVRVCVCEFRPVAACKHVYVSHVPHARAGSAAAVTCTHSRKHTHTQAPTHAHTPALGVCHIGVDGGQLGPEAVALKKAPHDLDGLLLVVCVCM